MKLFAANSFESVACEWWREVHEHDVVPDHAMRNRRRLEMYVFPFLGSVPLAQITQGDLLAVLRKLDPEKITTAHRVRRVCAPSGPASFIKKGCADQRGAPCRTGRREKRLRDRRFTQLRA